MESCISISSRGLHESMTRSWRGMQDSHLKIPTHFLLDGCMHLGYQILRLGDLFVHGQEQGRKAEGKRFNHMVAKWLNRNRSVGALCIWQVEYLEHNVDAGMLQGEGCGMIMVHTSYIEYHDTLLLTCQHHRLVVFFTSKNDTQKVAPYILSIHIPPCPTSFR